MPDILHPVSHHEQDSLVLPQALAARPIDPRRGVPTPVMNMRVNSDTNVEEPDFTTINGDAVYRCGTDRLCGICGTQLGYWIAFVGGEQSAANRNYSDPAFHPECATAAMQLCPYIAVQRHRRAPEHRLGDHTVTPAGLDESKPETFVIGITRDYKMTSRGGYVVFKPAPFKELRRYSYVEGRIVEQP